MTAPTTTSAQGQDSGTALIHRAFVFTLDPTDAQEQAFESHCGGSRFAYNHMLAKVKANLDQRAAEKTYGIADADLTPSMSWSAISLNNTFNAVKDDVAPWHTENSSRVYGYAMRDRQSPDRRTGQAGSNRWRKAQARIAKVEYRIAAIREDTLHKATTSLAQDFDIVVTETLNVTGMTMKKGGAKKRGFNRGLARASMGTTLNMLSYKATRNEKVSRWFPSSKTCSGCGAVKANLLRGAEVYECDHAMCGLVIDRDLNAAINLARCGELIDNAGSPLVPGRGAKRKPDPNPSGTGTAAGCEASNLTPGGNARTKAGVAGNGGTLPSRRGHAA